MSGSDVTTPEVKSYIWLKTSDGSIEQVEQNVALFCPLIRQTVHGGMGLSKVCPIPLPETIDLIILGVIIDFCHFYHQPGHSNLERKLFNEKFIRMNKKRLRELRIAADSLQLTPLVELTRAALLRLIEGSTSEEIRQAFELLDDLTEEDQWEPITIATDDPQVRLLNKLGERKRRELRQKEKVKNVEAEAPHVDHRSIDELMSFISGEHEGPKKTKACKSKKNQKGKDKQKTTASVSGWPNVIRGYIDGCIRVYSSFIMVRGKRKHGLTWNHIRIGGHCGIFIYFIYISCFEASCVLELQNLLG